ncbi:MAG: 50S ribosomal protein L35ae [Candidatus Aenigmatarchaeota archaeon]|nr:50S ribosomal protein L35ae [Candidatus Aenigmarchaeota archaeon]
MSLKGIIVNFHIAYTKEILVTIPGINNKREAAKLIGKKAVWKNGKEYIGKVSGTHGKSGTIKVKFKKPLPPTSLGKIIEILD